MIVNGPKSEWTEWAAKVLGHDGNQVCRDVRHCMPRYNILHEVNGSSTLQGCGAAVKAFVGKYNTTCCVETCSRRRWDRRTDSQLILVSCQSKHEREYQLTWNCVTPFSHPHNSSNSRYLKILGSCPLSVFW